MTILTGRYDDAFRYAREVHAGQTRKRTGSPYLSHLMGVASIALDDGGSEDEAIAVAYYASLVRAYRAAGGGRLVAELERIVRGIEKEMGTDVLRAACCVLRARCDVLRATC